MISISSKWHTKEKKSKNVWPVEEEEEGVVVVVEVYIYDRLINRLLVIKSKLNFFEFFFVEVSLSLSPWVLDVITWSITFLICKIKKIKKTEKFPIPWLCTFFMFVFFLLFKLTTLTHVNTRVNTHTTLTADGRSGSTPKEKWKVVEIKIEKKFKKNLHVGEGRWWWWWDSRRFSKILREHQTSPKLGTIGRPTRSAH